MYIMRDKTFPRSERAEAIYEMRTYVRKHFTDVRNRGDIGLRLWHFVSSIENPGSVSLDDVLEGATKRTRKRKAPPKPDDEDGDEYRPAAVSYLGPAKKTRSTKKR